MSSICSYGWNDDAATVVCRSLGYGWYGRASFLPRDYSLERSMYNVHCTGNESNIFVCQHDLNDVTGWCHYYYYYGDAGVNCSNNHGKDFKNFKCIFLFQIHSTVLSQEHQSLTIGMPYLFV